MTWPCGQVVAVRRAWQGWALPWCSRRAWTGPKDGAVRVMNRVGWVVTVSGTPLPPIGAGGAAGGAAGLARDAQDAVGFGAGGVAVQELAGGAVVVVDLAA